MIIQTKNICNIHRIIEYESKRYSFIDKKIRNWWGKVLYQIIKDFPDHSYFRNIKLPDMNELKVLQAVLSYLESAPKTLGLCTIERIVSYNIHKTVPVESIIKKYKPNWKSKFWWNWNYDRFGFSAYWWPLNDAGKKQRIRFIKHLIEKCESATN